MNNNEIIKKFGEIGLLDRWHIKKRLKRARFAWLSQFVPTKGAILDLGCGHGLFSFFLHKQFPERNICGIDIDERKIILARRAFKDKGLDFAKRELSSFAEASFDAVLVIDVIYLLQEDRQFILLNKCLNLLKLGGVLLIKMADPNSYDRYYAYAHELVMKFAFGRTKGEKIAFTDPGLIEKFLKNKGCECRMIDTLGAPKASKTIVCRKIK